MFIPKLPKQRHFIDGCGFSYYIAGTPFPLLGHNHNYAYGLTMFENDDVDFFQEENNPNNDKQYKTVDGFKNYTCKQKTIKVKDSVDYKLNVKTSQHGPIVNGLLDGLKSDKPVASSSNGFIRSKKIKFLMPFINYRTQRIWKVSTKISNLSKHQD